MKNKIISLIFLTATLLLFSNCNENVLLDKSPQDAPNSSNFFVDASTARKADIGIITNWTSYWMYSSQMLNVLDIMSDDSYTRLNSASRFAMLQWTFGASGPVADDIFANWWLQIYMSINSANFAIDIDLLKIPSPTLGG